MQPILTAMLAGAVATIAVPITPAPQAAPERQLALPQAGSAANCNDRIVQARSDAGLPRLDKSTPSKNEALLIAAVDKRIDGCSVMVMRSDLNDFRPLPEYSDEAKLQPAQP